MPAKLIDIRAEGRQRVDRYDLVAEIASGGMATVYLARLSGVGGFQRFVALKRLHPHLASDDEFVQMFLDEARLAAGIHHPNVVPILEVGASDRGHYLVMEYIEGDTLARLLARAAGTTGGLPLSVGLRVVVDMLAGLHAAHELRDEKGQPTELVHRDVSPQNVLVGTDGISRITDFGVARAASRLSGTRAGQLKGKIAYMAPEQAAGKDIDRRADVFAAGIVLWEVLASKRLFKAENEAATLSRVLNAPITSTREYAPEVSPEIDAVCLKALERDPELRFATAADFADAIERVAGSTATLRVGTQREVATAVAQALGQELTVQRDAVRSWVALSEPSRTEPNGSAHSSASKSQPPGTVSSAAVSFPASPGKESFFPHLGQVSDVTRPQPVFLRNRRSHWKGVAALSLGLVGGITAVVLWVTWDTRDDQGSPLTRLPGNTLSATTLGSTPASASASDQTGLANAASSATGTNSGSSSRNGRRLGTDTGRPPRQLGRPFPPKNPTVGPTPDSQSSAGASNPTPPVPDENFLDNPYR